MNYTYIVTPIVGALIGWGTNYVAVKMLFRPRKEINILGLKIQGVFPKRQPELAIKIADIVANELVGTEKIEQLKNNITSENISKKINSAMDSFVKNRILQVFPMASMFLGEDSVGQIKALFTADLRLVIDDIFTQNSDSINSLLNLRNTVKVKVEKFSTEKLENIILEVMSRELKFVEFVGGVLGFLVGVVQVLVFNFIQ